MFGPVTRVIYCWRPLLLAACAALLRHILLVNALFTVFCYINCVIIFVSTHGSRLILDFAVILSNLLIKLLFSPLLYVLCHDSLYLYCIAFDIALLHLLVLNHFHHATIYIYQGSSLFDKEKCDKQAIITTH